MVYAGAGRRSTSPMVMDIGRTPSRIVGVVRVIGVTTNRAMSRSIAYCLYHGAYMEFGPTYGCQECEVIAMRQNSGESISTPKRPKPKKQTLFMAARALLDDVRRRYPGEQLRCPYMQALDVAVRNYAKPKNRPGSKPKQ